MKGLLIFIPLLIPILIAVFGFRMVKKASGMSGAGSVGNIFNAAMGGMQQAAQIDAAAQNVISNPCEETAQALLHAINCTNEQFLFATSNRNGRNITLWKNAFYGYIRPSNRISLETKRLLRDAFMRISVFLDPVIDPKEIGDKGEDNVCFTLDQLGINRPYRYLRNISLPYTGNTVNSQEFDAILLCPKGVFLIEVKSRVSQKHRVFTYQDIGNPFQQVVMHRDAFMQNIPGILPKNLVVLSYPKGHRVSFDLSSFPEDSLYEVTTVENLYQYFENLTGPDVLNEAQIHTLYHKIQNCAIVPTPQESAQYAETNFCPNCGNRVGTPSFCPYCGTQL